MRQLRRLSPNHQTLFLSLRLTTSKSTRRVDKTASKNKTQKNRMKPSKRTATSDNRQELLHDDLRHRPPPQGFSCGEVLDADGEVGSVTFFCTVPHFVHSSYDGDDNDKESLATTTTTTERLEFSCRGRSVGVLEQTESVVNDEELDELTDAATVDPCFFDSGYTLAGRTGFQVWAGSRLLLESLLYPLPDIADSPRLVHWQERLRKSSSPSSSSSPNAPTRVLELGAGVGLVGASLAAVGAQVLVTDLPTLVENAIHPNLLRNQKRVNTPTTLSPNEALSPPGWLQAPAIEEKETQAVPIGKGWVYATPLDWTKPTNEQLLPQQRKNLDLILASDCVWLVSMLDALLDTVSSLFHESPQAAFVMSFQRRDKTSDQKNQSTTSALFTTVDRVLDAVEQRNWTWECLAWRYVTVEGEVSGDEERVEERKEVFVFEILPPPL